MNNYKQRGITLVEILIALVVSLVLIAGVGTVYTSSKRNYQARDQLSSIDENARVALETLKRHLEHAGYAANGVFPLEHPFLLQGTHEPEKVGCAGGFNIKTRSSFYFTQDGGIPAPGANVRNDAIGIALLGDNRMFRDCGNGLLPAGCRREEAPTSKAALIYNSFNLDQPSSAKYNSVGDVIPALYCSGSLSGQRTMVAQGIESIEFMYGIDLGGDGTVERYANADEVAADEWGRVVSIKVALLVKSLEPVFPDKKARSYSLLDDVVVSKDDRYQRAVYTAVIQLRNRV